MKQYLLILGLLVVLVSAFSCKKDPLDALRADELTMLDKYIKDNNLADTKDDSGIYFKLLQSSTDTTQIRSGYKVQIYFNVTLIDSAVVFTTEDGKGHNYEEFSFYVDVSNTVVNSSYVQQIAGLHKGLKKMKVGEKAFMVIPSELAFKAVDNSSIGVPRFSTLLATVTIKSALSPEQQKDL
jgi:hypothetical protein